MTARVHYDSATDTKDEWTLSRVVYYAIEITLIHILYLKTHSTENMVHTTKNSVITEKDINEIF